VSTGYHTWVADAPDHWKTDDFLKENSPIIITSCYSQNARIAIPGKEDDEAAAWDLKCNYSKVAFLTFALATSIEYAPPLCCSKPHPHLLLFSL